MNLQGCICMADIIMFQYCYLCIILIIVRENIPTLLFAISRSVQRRHWYHVVLGTETNLITSSPMDNHSLFIIVLTDYDEHMEFRCRHSHLLKCRLFCLRNVVIRQLHISFAELFSVALKAAGLGENYSRALRDIPHLFNLVCNRQESNVINYGESTS